MSNYSEILYSKIYKTKGARFLAYKRLQAINSLSVWAISLSSIYVISISLVSIKPFTRFSRVDPQYLSLITIFLSILIIVVSVIENAKNYTARAENLHSCGKELSFIYDRICQIKDLYESDSLAKVEIHGLGQQYEGIIDKYSENHRSIDFDMYVNSINNKWLLNSLLWFYIRLPYYLAIFLPLIVLILFVFTIPTANPS